MPAMTNTSVTDVQPLIALTQIYGDFSPKTRPVWVNPAAVAYIAEQLEWVSATDHRVTRQSRIYLVNGESIRVTETPECVAAAMGWVEA